MKLSKDAKPDISAERPRGLLDLRLLEGKSNEDSSQDPSLRKWSILLEVFWMDEAGRIRNN